MLASSSRAVYSKIQGWLEKRQKRGKKDLDFRRWQKIGTSLEEVLKQIGPSHEGPPTAVKFYVIFWTQILVPTIGVKWRNLATIAVTDNFGLINWWHFFHRSYIKEYTLSKYPTNIFYIISFILILSRIIWVRKYHSFWFIFYIICCAELHKKFTGQVTGVVGRSMV